MARKAREARAASQAQRVERWQRRRTGCPCTMHLMRCPVSARRQRCRTVRYTWWTCDDVAYDVQRGCDHQFNKRVCCVSSIVFCDARRRFFVNMTAVLLLVSIALGADDEEPAQAAVKLQLCGHATSCADCLTGWVLSKVRAAIAMQRDAIC